MQGRHGGAAGMVLLVVLAGCGDTERPISPDPGPIAEPASLAEAFDAGQTGTIHGRVFWQGSIPQVPPFQVAANPNFFPPWPESQPPQPIPNPNAPVIGADGGVGNAVVFLRRVDLHKSRPWDHGPVTVAVQDYRFQVEQGSTTAPTGFVRRGDAVTFVSREERFHAVRGRLAAFFSLTLPRPHEPRTRTLTATGLVELSSAAEYYWLRAYLFVDDHPYYTRTDAQGHFTLPLVPAGDHELVAWMPNWREAGHDRNPDVMHYSRLYLGRPPEQTHQVTVRAGKAVGAEFTFRSELFIN